ncbi:MAG: hypothetical protein JNN27_14340 [Planctomycetes bacterium]|nr:hypothetical protein [Planctomycetota bacterium]
MVQRLSLVAIFALLASRVAPAQTFFGPTPYLSTADSPFPVNTPAFVLEDFEDGLLNAPGVAGTGGIVTSTSFSGSIIDSVDADDGVIDGACAGGDSYFGGSATVTFHFDAGVLGGHPRKVGVVWTDGGPNALVTFEAFDSSGVSLGSIVAGNQGDNNYFGTTVDDRFYGVSHAGGIGRITISHNVGGLEVDHLQYELPCGANPATTYCTAKTNSLGCAPQVGASGCPSASSGLPFVISCSQVITNRPGLLFYGYAAAASPFQGGFLCVLPPTVRTPIQSSGGGPPPDTCAGLYAFDMNEWTQGGNDSNLVAGATVYAQYWMRDPASPSTTGLSNALSFTVNP